MLARVCGCCPAADGVKQLVGGFCFARVGGCCSDQVTEQNGAVDCLRLVEPRNAAVASAVSIIERCKGGGVGLGQGLFKLSHIITTWAEGRADS